MHILYTYNNKNNRKKKSASKFLKLVDFFGAKHLKLCKHSTNQVVIY